MPILNPHLHLHHYLHLHLYLYLFHYLTYSIDSNTLLLHLLDDINQIYLFQYLTSYFFTSEQMTSNKCASCQKTVFLAEETRAADALWHKMWYVINSNNVAVYLSCVLCTVTVYCYCVNAPLK